MDRKLCKFDLFSSVVTSFETNNKYKVQNSLGQQVYFAAEGKCGKCHIREDKPLYFLSYKVQCFIGISDTDKTDGLTCEIIYDNFTSENYRFLNNHQSWLLERTVVYIINRKIHGYLEIPDLFRVLNMILLLYYYTIFYNNYTI